MRWCELIYPLPRTIISITISAFSVSRYRLGYGSWFRLPYDDPKGGTPMPLYLDEIYFNATSPDAAKKGSAIQVRLHPMRIALVREPCHA